MYDCQGDKHWNNFFYANLSTLAIFVGRTFWRAYPFSGSSHEVTQGECCNSSKTVFILHNVY